MTTKAAPKITIKRGHYEIEGVGTFRRVSSWLNLVCPKELTGWARNQAAAQVEGYLEQYEGYLIKPDLIAQAVAAAKKPPPRTAAEQGERAHAVILDGIETDDPELLNMRDGFNSWLAEMDLVPAAKESVVWSTQYEYAGTLDMVAIRPNGRFVLDIKTSKVIYPEHHLQTAAYAHAAEEMGAGEISGTAVVRLEGDGTVDVQWRMGDEWRLDFEAFRHGLILARWFAGSKRSRK